MPPKNPMTEGEALAVLRELRDTGDVSDWQAMESALTMAVNRLTAHTAASGGEVVAWQIRYIDPDEGPSTWGPLPEKHVAMMSERPDYEVRPLYTAPPAAVPADALERLVEKWRHMPLPRGLAIVDAAHAAYSGCADELAALIPKGADHE